MLIAISDNKLVGYGDTLEDIFKTATVTDTATVIVLDDIGHKTGGQITDIYNVVMGENIPRIRNNKQKAKRIKEIQKKVKTLIAERKPKKPLGICARVREICDANKEKRCVDIVDLCVAEGINRNTAMGVYVLWKREQ